MRLRDTHTLQSRKLRKRNANQSPQTIARLVDWVYDGWVDGVGRVQRTDDNTPERDIFINIARGLFSSENIPTARIRTWFNIQKPDMTEGKYDDGYPHVHADSEAVTLVYYLDPGQDKAKLDVFDGDQVIETIEPEADLAVFIPNGVWHGVRKNRGPDDRIALIATAYPR